MVLSKRGAMGIGYTIDPVVGKLFGVFPLPFQDHGERRAHRSRPTDGAVGTHPGTGLDQGKKAAGPLGLLQYPCYTIYGQDRGRTARKYPFGRLDLSATDPAHTTGQTHQYGYGRIGHLRADQ